MPVADDLVDSYEQLMAMSRKMLQSGHYEVAFHALQAAFHCAEDLKDEQYLADVQQEAIRQRDFINTTTPEHRLSTQTAVQRGGQNLYDLLLRQISMQITQIERQHRQEHLGLPKNL